MSLFPRTFVAGIPRPYSTDGEKQWKEDIKRTLSPYAGQGRDDDRTQVRYKVKLTFHVDPLKHAFGPHGPDLDNMLKPVMDALKGSGIIWDDQAVYEVTASKEIMTPTQETGMWVEVERMS